MNFLLKTKLKEILKDNLINDLNISLSLFHISKNIEYQYFQKRNVINEISNFIDDKYFVVIQGSITIFCLEEKIQDFLLEEFFKYLKEIREKNQEFLIPYIEALNKNFSVFDFSNPDKYKHYFFTIKLKELIMHKKNAFSFINLFKEYNKLGQEETYGIDFKEMEKLEINNENYYPVSSPINPINPSLNNKNITIEENKINFEYVKYIRNLEKTDIFKEDYLNQFFSEEEIEFFGKMNLNEKFIFKAYKIEADTNYITNDYISEYDFVFNKINNFRLILFNDDTHMAVIKKDIYQEYILSEKNRINTRNMHYLYDLLFGKFMNKQIFEKRYFEYFKYEELNKGDVLFKENEKLDFMYLIVEGNLDLCIKRNILAVNDSLIDLISLDEQFQSKLFNYL